MRVGVGRSKRTPPIVGERFEGPRLVSATWIVDRPNANLASSRRVEAGCRGRRRNLRPGCRRLRPPNSVASTPAEGLGRLKTQRRQGFHQEVRRPHASFDRAEWVLNRLAPQTYGHGIFIEPTVDGFKHVLVFPAGNPARP